MSSEADDVTRRLTGLESLLRRLHRGTSADDAVQTVRRFLPDMAHGGEATLFLTDGERVIGLDEWSERFWPLAEDAIRQGRSRKTEDGATVAVPVPDCGALVVSVPDYLPPSEVQVLRLFAEHASTALRQLGLRPPAVSA
jgi:hypothetical protein